MKMKLQANAIVISLFVLLVVTVSVFSQTGKGELIITVTGFETDNGVARLAIVDSKSGHETGRNFLGMEIRISGHQAAAVVPDIPYGEYAVKVFHDENRNNELDTGVFGIPVERYGFSNNARGAFGPPAFAEISFDHLSPRTRIDIQVQ